MHGTVVPFCNVAFFQCIASASFLPLKVGRWRFIVLFIGLLNFVRLLVSVWLMSNDTPSRLTRKSGMPAALGGNKREPLCLVALVSTCILRVLMGIFYMEGVYLFLNSRNRIFFSTKTPLHFSQLRSCYILAHRDTTRLHIQFPSFIQPRRFTLFGYS